MRYKRKTRKIRKWLCIITMQISYLIVMLGTWGFAMIAFMAWKGGSDLLGGIFSIFAIFGYLSLFYAEGWLEHIKKSFGF